MEAPDAAAADRRDADVDRRDRDDETGDSRVVCVILNVLGRSRAIADARGMSSRGATEDADVARDGWVSRPRGGADVDARELTVESARRRAWLVIFCPPRSDWRVHRSP